MPSSDSSHPNSENITPIDRKRKIDDFINVSNSVTKKIRVV